MLKKNKKKQHQKNRSEKQTREIQEMKDTLLSLVSNLPNLSSLCVCAFFLCVLFTHTHTSLISTTIGLININNFLYLYLFVKYFECNLPSLNKKKIIVTMNAILNG